MKKIKLVMLGVIFAGCLMILGNKSYAASASISASSTSVTPGTAVTVSASVSATETYNLRMTASGGSLTGNTANADAFGTEKSQGVLSGTFSASTPGTYTITLSGTVAGSNLQIANVSKSVSITVKQNSSNNNNNGGNNNGGNGGTTVTAPTLSNLGITPHDFTGFSPSKTSYTANVPNDCTTINLYARSKNGNVSGTGSKTLKEGTNKFAVTVSNDAGSKTYYVSVVRKTADGTEPPNVIDEETPDGTETPEEQQDGIGLATLEIPGYELDKEFKSDVYTYTIKVKKQLTEEELETLKEKVVATANVENVKVDIITNISDEGVATITVVVKDDEKEYAKYVITFEVEKEDTKVAGIINSNSNNPLRGMFGLTEEQQIYVILGVFGGITLFAMIMTGVAYAKSKRLAEYEEDYDEEERDEDSDFYKMNQYYMETQANDWNKTPETENDRSSEMLEEASIKDTVKDATEGIRKTNGYRRMARGRRSYGKH